MRVYDVWVIQFIALHNIMFFLVPIIPGGNAYGAYICLGLRSHAGAGTRKKSCVNRGMGILFTVASPNVNL